MSASRAIQSMTGSGVATGDCEIGRLSVELRSVNGRSLSVRQRLAPECVRFDAAIEKLVRKRFVRGTVTVAIDVVESAVSVAPSVDVAAFGRAVTLLRDLADEHGIAGLTMRDVLSIPGVVGGGPDRVRVSSDIPEGLARLVGEAVDALEQRRVAEGGDTITSMRGSLDGLVSELAQVRVRAPELAAAHRESILARVGEYLERHGTQLEPADVVREVALFADRADVNEEMERLDAHAERLVAELSGKGPVGRDVEFLLQEMLREVNTLGSKSPDVTIAHHVVAMKSWIDALKEQSANLE